MSDARTSSRQHLRVGRRIRAEALQWEGWTGAAIAAAPKVCEGVVSGWLKQARLGGVAALRRHPVPRHDRLPRTCAWSIIHALEHLHEHVGHTQYTRQL